ncbi:MAG: ester cyclase [Chloroflexota bacterium]|nr:ester cyclase [Chloroflexota bacterium]
MITDVPHTDISHLMNPGPEKRQPMAGFDADYVDIVDYIVRCTHKIWEEGGIGRIYSHYQHNMIIHTADGTTYGRDKVIADSTKTMSAFPDVRLFADDVIWSGNDREGFHSSHRIQWTGTNTGYSVYGPPTGRRVTRYGIAHCFVKANRVVEEWICRDELAVVRQLGFDAHDLARRMALKTVESGQGIAAPAARGELDRRRGQNPPEPVAAGPVDPTDVENFVRRTFHEIWNWRLLHVINERFAPHYLAWTPGYRKVYGRGDYKAWILSLLAMFSDLALQVDHVCWVPGPSPLDYRVATRWFIQGTHDGPGWYGEPTGKRIFLLGITHQHVQNGQFVQEWSCFDEFAVLKQLAMPG